MAAATVSLERPSSSASDRTETAATSTPSVSTACSSTACQTVHPIGRSSRRIEVLSGAGLTTPLRWPCAAAPRSGRGCGSRIGGPAHRPSGVEVLVRFFVGEAAADAEEPGRLLYRAECRAVPGRSHLRHFVTSRVDRLLYDSLSARELGGGLSAGPDLANRPARVEALRLSARMLRLGLGYRRSQTSFSGQHTQRSPRGGRPALD